MPPHALTAVIPVEFAAKACEKTANVDEGRFMSELLRKQQRLAK
jgi:hypothetical protein